MFGNDKVVKGNMSNKLISQLQYNLDTPDYTVWMNHKRALFAY